MYLSFNPKLLYCVLYLPPFRNTGVLLCHVCMSYLEPSGTAVSFSEAECNQYFNTAVAKRCKYKNLSNVHLWWMNKRNECQLGRFSFVLKLTCTMWLRFTSSPKIYACRVLYIRTAYDIYDNGYAYLRVGYTDKLFD